MHQQPASPPLGPITARKSFHVSGVTGLHCMGPSLGGSPPAGRRPNHRSLGPTSAERIDPGPDAPPEGTPPKALRQLGQRPPQRCTSPESPTTALTTASRKSYG